jgi:hypothetical protein
MIDPERRRLLAAEIARAWPAAKARWSRFLLLSDPDDNPHSRSVAQIDLATRQVSLNWPEIIRHDLDDCVEALLAHEVGHHVRYPGTLQVDARMRILEKTLLPLDGYTLTNLFTDLLINEYLGRKLHDPLVKIYRAFTTEPAFHQERKWKRDPVFLFYLSLYEALWRLDRGTVMGPSEEGFARRFRGYRSESELLVDNLFAMGPNVYAQFLYFLSFAVRYIKPADEENPTSMNPNHCSAAEPSPDDWADALTPTAAERAAVERALGERWFDPSQSERLKQAGDLEERITRLPGNGTADARAVPEIMASYYRRQAEALSFRPPPQPRWGEAVVPTTLDDWEPGDSPREIDWLATLTLRGLALGGAAPLKRTHIAEIEGAELRLWQPRTEIYLDVSGSMPNPCLAVNAMTLAAQILTLGTVRAGGWVRALLYSHEPVTYWEWCRSEVEMSRFLMHYVGGGTDFPFDILDESVRECKDDQPIRVIISDTDFDANYDGHRRARGIVARAAEASPHFILMQHNSDAAKSARYGLSGARVIPVADMADFPKMARDLAWTLFPEGEHGVVS